MIGLQCPARYQSLRTLVTCFCYQEFQFTSLVAAKGEPGLVVALNQQMRSA